MARQGVWDVPGAEQGDVYYGLTRQSVWLVVNNRRNR